MRVKVILNPYANRWNAKQKIPQIEAALQHAQVDYELAVTERAKQATELAQAAVGHFDAVVSAGGDGTLNEVMNGLVAASEDGPTLPLAVLPVGTGNDFAYTAQSKLSLEAWAQMVAQGRTKQVDLGSVNGHFFDNNCALAMEPLVTVEHEKIMRLKGNMRYLVALINALRKLKAWQMTIKWDGGEVSGPLVLVSVCNTPRTGSMFHLAPPARLDDGLLDVVIAKDMPLRRILPILPRLINGSHLGHPKVRHFRVQEMTITSQPGTPIHADGELIALSAETIHYKIHPGKLTLITDR